MSKKHLPMFRGTPDSPARKLNRDFIAHWLDDNEGKKQGRVPTALFLAMLRAALIPEAQSLVFAAHEHAPACTAGCSHCCKLPIDVDAMDLFRLAHFIGVRWSDERRAALLDRLRANVDRARATDSLDAYARASIACALLDENGQCSSYADRPAACVRWHSFDVTSCARAGEPGVSTPIDQLAFLNGQAIDFATSDVAARRFQRVDVRYDLQAGLLIALTTPNGLERWSRGEDVLVSALRRGAGGDED